MTHGIHSVNSVCRSLRIRYCRSSLLLEYEKSQGLDLQDHRLKLSPKDAFDLASSAQYPH